MQHKRASPDIFLCNGQNQRQTMTDKHITSNRFQQNSGLPIGDTSYLLMVIIEKKQKHIDCHLQGRVQRHDHTSSAQWRRVQLHCLPTSSPGYFLLFSHSQVFSHQAKSIFAVCFRRMPQQQEQHSEAPCPSVYRVQNFHSQEHNVYHDKSRYHNQHYGKG
jgi:hypothetical protein